MKAGCTVDESCRERQISLSRKYTDPRMEPFMPRHLHFGKRTAESLVANTLACGELRGKNLLAQTEFLNDRFIALGIVFLEVVQQATPLADHHEKTAA